MTSMSNKAANCKRITGLPLLVFVSIAFTASALAQDAGWERELAAWRTQHATDLQKSEGWLSVVGLEWLDSGDNSFGSAVDNKIHLPAGGPDHLGVLHLQGTTVSLNPPPGGFPKNFLVDGKPAQLQELHTDPDRGDKNNPRMTVGTLNLYVVNRGERFALRVKDSQAPARINFHGLNWFPPDPNYRFRARWIPYNPPKSLTLTTLIGTTYARPVPGAAEFTFDGKTFRLEPVFEDPTEAKLHFVLRDTTSTSTTYGACRFLYTGFPSEGLDRPGEIILDFNHLENPPCAYTPYATCPLPPPGNRLTIALPVGEKRYHD
jgi:uncharacterized protein (DUF1684 family)